LISLAGLAKILQRLHIYRIEKLLGCKPPRRLNQSKALFGLDFISEFVSAARSHRVLEHIRNLHEKYDYTFAANVLGDTFFHTSEPENIKALLSTQFADFSLGWKRHRDFSPLLGDGIFTVDGPAWKHSRDMLRPNFTKVQLDGNLSTLEKHFQLLLTQTPPDGCPIDLQQLFLKLTMDVSTEFLFGVSTNSLSIKENDSMDIFCQAFEDAQWGVSLRPRLGALNDYYTNPKFTKACAIVHGYVEDLIECALAEKAVAQRNAKEGSQYCFLQKLSEVVPNQRELRDHALSVLLAGRDTTAGLLSITFFVLARRPDVWKRLQHEVEELQGALPTFEQLKDMTYLQYVLKEVLRLYPTTPLNNRHANKDTTLPVGGGADGRSKVLIRKDQRVTFAVYAMHRRKDLFGADAEEFRPERWQYLRPGWNYLPFNGGPRTCLGQQFAITESSYVIVRLLQEFKNIEPRDPEPFTELLGLTLASKNGCLVSLT
ncbi:putative cytochrome P450, partial [Phaeosphaeria sp. MPI-PUGE-AT-0046c]